MAGGDIAVRVEGLTALRRDLRAIDRGLGRELTTELREAASLVAEAARGLTPRRTGALAGSLKAGAAGSRAYVRSTLPYANVVHWGGTTGRGHLPGHGGSGSVRIRGSFFVTRAMEQNEERVVDKIGEGIDSLAIRHGFR